MRGHQTIRPAHSSCGRPFSVPVSAAAAAACCAALRARRSSPSNLHVCLCPLRQSACEQAVPQYRTVPQALRRCNQREETGLYKDQQLSP